MTANVSYVTGEMDQVFSDSSIPSNPQLQPAHSQSLSSHNKVFKSGPLFISSKGIGWTSWKKRWFILTQTSLVFFRSDPNVVSQKGNEVNLTLGGIDLNNSGSVSIKEDKKLLTVQFPDARDGRVFTLKAETTEDLYEWKTALENVLAHAPSATNVTGQSGIFKSGQADSLDSYLNQLKDRDTVKYEVLGRPILLALEEVDGTPSFLEKALRFIEEHGAKVEGILRQAADVEDVENRVREYEQGKVEFSEKEDAHVVADCVKLVIRELRSFPVPASCCKALLEASRTARANRVLAMRAAIWDTFPEPNRRLLQRILLMMQTVASLQAENRMSSSAVAACMAPLLLRPLLIGDCEVENDFDVGGDGSIQLLQAAAAANHAQAIVITLLEEYNTIFEEGSSSPGPDMYMDSEDGESESEEATDDDLSYDDYYDDEQDGSIEGSDVDADDDLVGETNSKTGDSAVNDEYDDKDHILSYSSSKSSEVSDYLAVDQRLSTISLEVSLPLSEDIKNCEDFASQNNSSCADESNEPCENFTSQNKTSFANDSTKVSDIIEGLSPDQTTMNRLNSPSSSSCMNKSITTPNGTTHQRRTVLGRNSGSKNLSMESIDFLDENEAEVERLEAVKTELQSQIAAEGKVNAKLQSYVETRKEAKVNAKLQSYVETRKEALQERRLVLERDVDKLQEQLLKEKNLRETLEAGLKFLPGTLSELFDIDEQTKTDFEELMTIEVDLANLELKVNELGARLSALLERNYGSMPNFCDQTQRISGHERNLKSKPDPEVAAISEYDRSISKQDNHFGGAENENERKPESTLLPNKHPPSSKKSGARVEGTNSPTSAMTRLTSKLNFLKDRRSQFTNDLQNMNKGKGFELQLPPPSPNKSRGFDFHIPLRSPRSRGNERQSPHLSPNKSRGCDFYIPLISPGRSRGSENHFPSISEKVRGNEDHLLRYSEKPRKSDSQLCHSPSISEKFRVNEDHSLRYSEKPRKSDSQPYHFPSISENVRGNEDNSLRYSEKPRKSDCQPYHSDIQNEFSQQYLKRGRSARHYPTHNVD
ncbi:rho GTPase-activating protein REN1-like isoform X2 [Vicia villosa]|uniref:rho GTPase-activating protein REN1-like isoform X2 n=1 Tax=Vicia villosa TaxID=3911 RepID=UPI00273A840B|nr:rho GTPase-activating protein REN1-like isoform X2 [Vicia villosa]